MTKAKFKVGNKVKIIGKVNDYTNAFNGYIGTVEKVNLFDCVVRIDGTNIRRSIWNNNLEVMDCEEV